MFRRSGRRFADKSMRQIKRATIPPQQPSRRAKSSPQRLSELFLDMLAAERGAGNNTLEAYGRDLDDLAQHLAGAGTTVAAAATADLRAYLAALAPGAL